MTQWETSDVCLTGNGIRIHHVRVSTLINIASTYLFFLIFRSFIVTFLSLVLSVWNYSAVNAHCVHKPKDSFDNTFYPQLWPFLRFDFQRQSLVTLHHRRQVVAGYWPAAAQVTNTVLPEQEQHFGVTPDTSSLIREITQFHKNL